MTCFSAICAFICYELLSCDSTLRNGVKVDISLQSSLNHVALLATLFDEALHLSILMVYLCCWILALVHASFTLVLADFYYCKKDGNLLSVMLHRLGTASPQLRCLQSLCREGKSSAVPANAQTRIAYTNQRGCRTALDMQVLSRPSEL